MRIFTALAAALFLVGAAVAQDRVATAVPQDAAAKSPFQRVAVYPLATCVISGEKLEADAVKFEAGGRTFMTCCDKCKAKVEKDPAAFAKKLDEAIVQQQLAAYPLDVCVISGKKLGSMGDPIKLVLDGTLVQLCCNGCVKKATAAPEAMAQKVLEAAYAAQIKKYPLDACVVTGEKLGADADEKPVDVMLGTTLVKLCCKGCIKKLEKDPARYLAIVAGKAKVGAEACDDDKKAGEAKEGKKAPMAMASAEGDGCCDSAATAQKVTAKAGAAECGSGCCGGCSEGAPAAKPVEKTKAAEAKTGGDCCAEGAAAQKPATKPVEKTR
jgi:YHS domain-containing protein